MISADIKYDTPLHKKLVAAIKERKKYSEKKMKDLHAQWDEADDSLKAYIPEKELDRRKKHNKKYKGDLDFVTLEVPYIYAQVMTAHTYWSTVFLSRSPVYQFSARHGEAQDSVQAVEAVLDYQLRVGCQLPVLYNALYDLTRYSLGIVGTYWDHEKKFVSSFQEVPQTIFGIPTGKTKKERVTQVLDGYVGNRLFNIRPHDWYPDPRVPMWRFQDGEFCGRDTSMGFSDLEAENQNNPGYYINLDALKAVARKNGQADYALGSPRLDQPFSGTDGGEAPGKAFVKLHEMYIKLVPKEWGLGKETNVEKWCFLLAEDEVLISVKPLGYLHDKFPMDVLEGNFGSNSFSKVGLIETIRPLTDVLTWLFNTHFYNTRKILNDVTIYDPSMVSTKDLLRPGPGGMIRLKPAAYGKDVRSAMTQMPVQDVTRGHLADAQMIEDMIQKAGGIFDNIMGSVNTSSRRTATEVRTASSMGSNRLKVPAEYNSSLFFGPLAEKMLSNTQQLMDNQRKYAIAGSLTESAQRFLDISPEMIAGFYDFVPVDGTAPMDRLAQANFWKELLMQMAKIPQLAAGWDMNGMIGHMMKLQGERNIERFRIQVQPPGVDMQGQAAKGNVIPLGVPNARGQNTGSSGTSGGTV